MPQSPTLYPITQTLELNEEQKTLPLLSNYGIAIEDHCTWSLNANGRFTISSLWKQLRTKYPEVTWSKLVWFPANIPKCSVISWLGILNRLSAEDRLVLFGIKFTSCCSLCTGSESDDHLFFNCPFSTLVWNSILSKLNVDWPAKTWASWVIFLSSLVGKSLRSTVIKLAFAVYIYHIWIERNVRKSQNVSCSAEVVVHKICFMVRLWFLSLNTLPKGRHADWFISEWKLSPLSNVY